MPYRRSGTLSSHPTQRELAGTLRTTVSDIVEQLFLITHEEDLEAAVTGKLYLFEKNETEDGLTRVATGE